LKSYVDKLFDNFVEKFIHKLYTQNHKKIVAKFRVKVCSKNM